MSLLSAPQLKRDSLGRSTIGGARRSRLTRDKQSRGFVNHVFLARSRTSRSARQGPLSNYSFAQRTSTRSDLERGPVDSDSCCQTFRRFCGLSTGVSCARRGAARATRYRGTNAHLIAGFASLSSTTTRESRTGSLQHSGDYTIRSNRFAARFLREFLRSAAGL